MPEIVYVLTNDAMEGMVKIGRTTTSVEQRIRELDTTSVPLPFQCFYAAEVGNSTLVETKLHRIFSDKRIRTNREFFRVDANQVREAIELAELKAEFKDVTPKEDVVVDASDIQALQRAVSTQERRSRLRFTELGISTGAVLTFAKDPQISCVVVADGKVEYQGQILTQSAAALLAMKSLGYQWAAVSGSIYWQLDGETLAARRLRLEDEQS